VTAQRARVPAPAAATAFDAATAIHGGDGPGAWRATIDPAWSAGRGPNGGYLAAIVLGAMVAELADPQREPRSLTCHYLRPPRPGDVRLEVALERAGRSLSTVTARLAQDDRLCVLGVGAFAPELPAAADYAGSPPAAPPPEDIAPLAFRPGMPPVVAQFETRPALGAPPLSGADEALAGGWLRLAEARPVDALALAMYADAWVPAPFARLRAPVAAPTIDLTVHFRAPAAAATLPPEEPVLAVFRSSTAAGGFFEEDGELWSRDGVLLAHSRQLALLTPDDGDRGR
jgi:acyl-CoA thioesterase